jgi:Fuc2NAc and GlcNAc transferase
MIIAFSLSLGIIGAWFISRYAYRFGLVDVPNDRSSHILPTPRGGGIGILASFMLTSLMLELPLLFWLPASMLSLFSLFDDRLDLSPRIRLVFQFCMALATVIPLVLTLHLSLSASLLLVLLFTVFLAGTANFFNFMDGINGIAGITGMVGFALVCIFAWTQAAPSGLVLSAACMSAACIGFLPFNMPSARVFMGDVGSILIGMAFAVFCCTLSRTLTDFAVMTGFFFPYYADSLTTLFVRWRNKERLSQSHRRHLYQLFANQKKVEHWKVSCCYGLLQAAIGTVLLIAKPAGFVTVVVLELILLAFWFLFMRKVRREVEKTTSYVLS